MSASISPFSVLRSSGAGRRRRAPVSRRRRGGNIFSDAGNWIRGAANTVYNGAIRPAARFIKNNHLISAGIGFIPHPAARAAAIGARIAGYGRRKRVRRRRGGNATVKGPMMPGSAPLRPTPSRARQVLNKVQTFLKKTKVISNALDHFGHSNYAGIARVWGYGKRRRVRRKRRAGGSFIGKVKKHATWAIPLAAILARDAYNLYRGSPSTISNPARPWGAEPAFRTPGFAGAGRRRRVRRRARGGSLISSVKRHAKWALPAAGWLALGAHGARARGAGRRRRVRRTTRRR